MELQVRLTNICLNKMYSKVRIGKYLSDNFPIQDCLKQGDTLTPLLFVFALEHAIIGNGCNKSKFDSGGN
jgi:hypothetical protein